MELVSEWVPYVRQVPLDCSSLDFLIYGTGVRGKTRGEFRRESDLGWPSVTISNGQYLGLWIGGLRLWSQFFPFIKRFPCLSSDRVNCQHLKDSVSSSSLGMRDVGGSKGFFLLPESIRSDKKRKVVVVCTVIREGESPFYVFHYLQLHDVIILGKVWLPFFYSVIFKGFSARRLKRRLSGNPNW